MAYIHRARNPSIYMALGARGGPGWGWRFDQTHMLAFGLVGLWMGGGIIDDLSAGGFTVGVRNLVSGARLMHNTTANPGAGIGPLGPHFETVGTAGMLNSLIEDFGDGREFTIAVLGRPIALTGGTGICAARHSGGVRNALLFTGSNTTPRYSANYGTNVTVTAAGDAWSHADEIHSILGVSRAADDHELFVDGVSVASSTSSAGTTVVGRNQQIIGQTAGGNGRNFQFTQVAYWNRALTSDEIAWWSAEPFAMLLPGSLE